VRKVVALISLIVAASMAGVGGSGGASLAVRLASASSAIAGPEPSGFVVPPGVSDPLCNGGRGVRLSRPFGQGEESAVVASATIADGSTLIAVSAVYPGKSYAVLDSVTLGCEPNPEFGVDGTATIAISPDLRPAHPRARTLSPEGLWIQEVAPRNGGGAIVTGTYRGDWVVGEVTPGGQLDATFADGGWTVLPFLGEVTQVLQEPSGRIIIAGDNGGGGCCTRNWAAALSASGQLEQAFGRHGRVELPTGEDSGVEGLSPEPNGDILVNVGHGNMGCWGTSLAMLTPSGQPVPQFANRLARFWQGLGFHAFIGDVYIEGEGFTLAGTGQGPCDEPRTSRSASPTGLVARFRVNGTPAGRTIRFRSRMYGAIRAFHDDGDTILVEYPYANPTQLTVTARRADGSLDPRFASLGKAQLRAPWTGPSAELADVAIIAAGPGEATLVATGGERPELQLIRLRL
jgi:hypothetical protein